VQRQYTGTAGRIENAQVGVYLVYAATGGHAFIDRALYLPKSTTEPERCRAAGVPDDVAFATRPALAAEMISRAVDAGVPASCVTGYEVYGGDSTLRMGRAPDRLPAGGGLRSSDRHPRRQTSRQGSGPPVAGDAPPAAPGLPTRTGSARSAASTQRRASSTTGAASSSAPTSSGATDASPRFATPTRTRPSRTGRPPTTQPSTDSFATPTRSFSRAARQVRCSTLPTPKRGMPFMNW
jgi:hypothetical protein